MASQKLREFMREFSDEEVPYLEFAVGECDWSDVEWLINEGYVLDIPVLVSAIENGNLEIAKRLIVEKNCPISSYLLTLTDDLEFTQWLVNAGCPLDDYVMLSAVSSGNIEKMSWLFEINCPWNQKMFLDAERIGGEVLEWVRTNYPIYDTMKRRGIKIG
jgi:hypothetical protein